MAEVTTHELSPNEKMKQLIYSDFTSGIDLEPAAKQTSADMPSHMTYERALGGIGP
jgi:hypothetical protein